MLGLLRGDRYRILLVCQLVHSAVWSGRKDLQSTHQPEPSRMG